MIYCEKCRLKMQAGAARFGELFEFVGGEALNTMFCDSCGDSINTGQHCYACCLLDSTSHPNYPQQRPEVWASEYLK